MGDVVHDGPATGEVVGVLRLVDGAEVTVTTDGLFAGGDPWAFFAEQFAEIHSVSFR